MFRPLRLIAASSLADSAVLPHRRAALSAGVEALPRVAAAECFPRAADSWCGASRSGASRGGGSAAARGGFCALLLAAFASFAGPRSPRLRRRGKSCAPTPPHPCLKLIILSTAPMPPSPRPSTTFGLTITRTTSRHRIPHAAPFIAGVVNDLNTILPLYISPPSPHLLRPHIFVAHSTPKNHTNLAYFHLRATS